MKKLLILLIIAGITFAQTREEIINDNKEIDSNKVLMPTEYHSKVNMKITPLLTRHHYTQVKLNDSLSTKIFDNYIESLDNNKLYFLKSDIDSFEKYRYEIDNYLRTGDLDAAYQIFNVYKTRLTERIQYAIARLQKKFDFTIDEYLEIDKENSTWAASKDELDDLWRKRLKNEALNSILDDKSWEKTSEDLTKRYKRFHKILLQYNTEDVFQIYMNSFAEAVDPHTSYFSPKTSDNFFINMSQSLEGIGAQLRSENDYTTVVRIIPGGPAAKSGLLSEDDKIKSVGQGTDGELVDVVGWRIDDVVQLIRGDKGTVVKLEILKADADPDMPSETITLVRDKVKLEEQSAKKEIIEIEEDNITYKLGVIELPTFYIDFDARRRGERDYKSTTRDVQKLLEELKTEKVDGIIVDLRNNGGGALDEAIALTGLFIKDGPVVQVKNIGNNVDVGKDPDNDIVYDGPLAVLINRFSASASEIFSGAIQDYGRGVIIGEQTYGKGTVQNMWDLKRFLPGVKDKLGQVKLTMAKYYRITGSSTQHLGVVPDIEFPTPVDPLKFGESAQQSALPWDQIQSTPFTKFGNLSPFFPTLRDKHNERMNKNPELQYLLEDIEEIKINREKKSFSLNEEKRKSQREIAKKKRELRDEARQKNSEIEIVDKKEVEVRNIKVDDPLLEEAGHILANLILMTIG
jgi:carboxyl-terminal processing protease